MGPYHPECPDRLRAIGDRLISAGLDVYLTPLRRRRPRRTSSCARVHGEGYIATIEAESPGLGTALHRSGHRDVPAFARLRRCMRRARWCSRPTSSCAASAAARSARSARRAITPSATARWGSACSTTSRSAPRTRLRRTASSASRSSISTCTTATAPRTSSPSDPRVLMVSTFQHPLYPYSGVDDPLGRTWSTSRSRAGSGGDAFREAVREHWLPALEAHRPEIIYVSAGFDAHREDPLAGPEADRGRLRVGDARADRGRRRHAQGPHRVGARRRLRAVRARAQRRRAHPRDADRG